MHAKQITAACSAVALMGSVPVVVKLSQLNVWTIGILRVAVGVAFLGAFCLVQGRAQWQVTRRDWPLLVLCGLLFGAHWLTYFMAIQAATPSIAVVGLSSYGLNLALIGWAVYGERITRLAWIGLLLSLIGVFIVIPRFDLRDTLTCGFAVGLLSGLFYAFVPIIHKRLLHIRAHERTLWQFVFAAPIFISFVTRVDLHVSTSGLLATVYLLLFGTILAHTLWTYVSGVLRSVALGALSYATVPVAMVISTLLAQESFTGSLVVGSLLIIAGNLVVLYQRAPGTAVPVAD